jgi:hypothetical protein
MPRKKKEQVIEEPKKEPLKIKVLYYWLIGSFGIIFFIFLIAFGNTDSDIPDYMTSKQEVNLKFNADVYVNETMNTTDTSTPYVPMIGPFDLYMIMAIVCGFIFSNTMFWRRNQMILKIGVMIGITMVFYYLFSSMIPNLMLP